MGNNLFLKKFQRFLPGYLFVLPALAVFGLFELYPIANAFFLSLFNYKNVSFVFAGLDNYFYLARDPIFLRSLLNSVIFVIGTVPLVLIFSVFVALTVYNKGRTLLALYRAAFYLPSVASIVTICIIWKWIYNPVFGLLNHITGLSINWLGNMRFSVPALIIVLFTIIVGEAIILYIAAIQNIPVTFSEAADIEY